MYCTYVYVSVSNVAGVMIGGSSFREIVGFTEYVSFLFSFFTHHFKSNYYHRDQLRGMCWRLVLGMATYRSGKVCTQLSMGRLQKGINLTCDVDSFCDTIVQTGPRPQVL